MLLFNFSLEVNEVCSFSVERIYPLDHYILILYLLLKSIKISNQFPPMEFYINKLIFTTGSQIF